MATATASLPAYTHTYTDATNVPVTSEPPSVYSRVIVSSDIYNPVLEQDYFLQADFPAPGIQTHLLAARYRFIDQRYADGWSRYTFFAVLLGMGPGATHEEINAAVVGAIGMTVDEAWPVYGPAYIPPGIDEGNAAQVYTNSPVSLVPVNAFIGNVCSATFDVVTPDPSDFLTGVSYMNNDGGYPNESLIAGLVNGSNTVSLSAINLDVNGNLFAITDAAYSVIFKTNGSLSTELTVSNAVVNIDYPAQDLEWTYTEFFADETPETPVAVNIVGTRYGVANLNHGFGIAPRKSRG